MRGLITHREVLANFGLIWREFGPGCVARCLFALVTRRRTTFLAVAVGLHPKPGEGERVDPLAPDAAGDGWRSC
ncbi:MAG TPA: hypothetical protein VE549_08490 [Myxococcaceae bacterium]|nr:hypothetical protein [Myxococcaceae bacterium]